MWTSHQNAFRFYHVFLKIYTGPQILHPCYQQIPHPVSSVSSQAGKSYEQLKKELGDAAAIVRITAVSGVYPQTRLPLLSCESRPRGGKGVPFPLDKALQNHGATTYATDATRANPRCR